MQIEKVIVAVNDALYHGEERLVRAYFSHLTADEPDPQAGFIVQALVDAAENPDLDEAGVIAAAEAMLQERVTALWEKVERLKAVKLEEENEGGG